MQSPPLFCPDRLPRKPFCSNDKTARHIHRLEKALAFSHIQVNPPGQLIWLVFDLDYAEGITRYRDELNSPIPLPNIVVGNPTNGHAQYFYCLGTPVNNGPTGRAKPKLWAESIYNGLGALLGADVFYTRTIAKNPLHPAHLTIWLRPEPFELAELDEYIFDRRAGREWIAQRRAHGREVNEKGRHCSLFDGLRGWAYDWGNTYKASGTPFERWYDACLAQAEKMNDFTGHPEGNLSFSAVRSTAKSVARWVWRRYEGRGSADADFIEVQRCRGRLNGQKKRDELLPRALSLASSGRTQREISSELGVPQKTVCRWLKRG